jgi:tetratricopeptide (TPR) repeat protein
LAYITGVECLKANDRETGIAQLRDSLSLAVDHLAETLKLAVESFDDKTIENELIPKQAAVMVACADWLEANASRSGLVTQLRSEALSLPELLSADSGDRYHLKATQLDKLGDVDGAIEAYRNALRFEPDNIDWRIERVTLLKQVGRLDEAIKEVNRIRGQNPDDRRATILMGELAASRLDADVQESD